MLQKSVYLGKVTKLKNTKFEKGSDNVQNYFRANCHPKRQFEPASLRILFSFELGHLNFVPQKNSGFVISNFVPYPSYLTHLNF